MALQFNQYSKQGLRLAMVDNLNSGTEIIRIYPSSVPYPSTPPSTMPAGHLVTFADVNPVLDGSTIILTSALSSTTVASGNLSWFMYRAGTTPNDIFISDSIGLSGSGKILVVNKMSVSIGEILTINFNLSLT